MSGLIHQSELKQELMDIEFLRLTQIQVAKDFTKVNSLFLDGFKDEVHSLSELEMQVGEQLAKQLELGQRETLQLLYTIDFPEQKFLELTQKPNFLAVLAQQIIYREAYKVWLRKNYSA